MKHYQTDPDALEWAKEKAVTRRLEQLYTMTGKELADWDSSLAEAIEDCAYDDVENHGK